MEYEGSDKVNRVLGIYTKLLNGAVINKAEEAQCYGVNERSIQRDIDDIRDFLDTQSVEKGEVNSVIYDRMKKGYCLETIYKVKLTNSEILALCKILLDSRAFTKEEMTGMLQRMIDCCVPKSNQKLVKDLISNEEFHYVDYTSMELSEILDSICKKNDYKMEDNLRMLINQYFISEVEKKVENFANGRLSRNVFDDLVMNHAKRVIQYSNPTDEDLTVLKKEDFVVQSPIFEDEEECNTLLQ